MILPEAEWPEIVRSFAASHPGALVRVERELDGDVLTYKVLVVPVLHAIDVNFEIAVAP